MQCTILNALHIFYLFNPKQHHQNSNISIYILQMRKTRNRHWQNGISHWRFVDSSAPKDLTQLVFKGTFIKQAYLISLFGPQVEGVRFIMLLISSIRPVSFLLILFIFPPLALIPSPTPLCLTGTQSNVSGCIKRYVYVFIRYMVLLCVYAYFKFTEICRNALQILLLFF